MKNNDIRMPSAITNITEGWLLCIYLFLFTVFAFRLNLLVFYLFVGRGSKMYKHVIGISTKVDISEVIVDKFDDKYFCQEDKIGYNLGDEEDIDAKILQGL